MKKVSVVIITHNDGKYVNHVFSSLANQDFRHFEVVVVDLCSIDSTLNKIQKFPVKVIRLAANEIDFARALNIGAAQSMGNTIFCLRGRFVPILSSFISSGITDISSHDAALAFGPRDTLGSDSLIKVIAKNLFSLPGFPRKKELTTNEIKEINLDGCVFSKNIWLTNPFPHDSTQPIWEWAFQMLDSGFKIIYDPRLHIQSLEETSLIDFMKTRKSTNNSFKKFYQEMAK
jgi:glycosyltransferase involved in cell wall biosynthesis